jgi:hypothetical protein
MAVSLTGLVNIASAQASSPLLSQGKTTTASSQEDAGTNSGLAVDGNTGTRWSSLSSDAQWLQVDLGSVQSIDEVKLNWETAYAATFTIQTSTNGTTWTNITPTKAGNVGLQDLSGLSGSGRYVRMNGMTRATGYGYSLFEFQVFGGTPPACGTTNVAQGKTATATSTEGAGYGAGSAVDGNTGTRWSSLSSDAQSLTVDLGASQSVCKIGLNWEAAYAAGFTIQTSPDGTTWTNITPTTAGNLGVQTISGLTGAGRYVRMNGLSRATGYGYSLFEFQVYTTTTTPPPPPPGTAMTVVPVPGTNVGTPAGTTLTALTGYTVTTAGTVLDSKNITGPMIIAAPNVVIKNSKVSGGAFWGIQVVAGGSLTIQDTTVSGFSEALITGDNYTATRVEVTGSQADGFKMGDNVLIQDSYCHDFAPAPGAHADCAQIQSGIHNVVVNHNWFDVGSSAGGGNSAMMLAPDLGPSSSGPLTVTNNVVGGGNYTIQCVDGANGTYIISNITLTGNRFLRNFQYGPLALTVPATASDNLYFDNGAPV